MQVSTSIDEIRDAIVAAAARRGDIQFHSPKRGWIALSFGSFEGDTYCEITWRSCGVKKLVRLGNELREPAVEDLARRIFAIL